MSTNGLRNEVEVGIEIMDHIVRSEINPICTNPNSLLLSNDTQDIGIYGFHEEMKEEEEPNNTTTIINADNIITAVRVRPMFTTEKKLGCRRIIDMSATENWTRIINPALLSADITDLNSYSNEYKFDYSFWSYDNSPGRKLATQQTLYETIGVYTIETAWQGYNCSVFAYGQTSAGKTHTMMGEEIQPDKNHQSKQGLIPRICFGLFDKINKQKAKEAKILETQTLNLTDHLTAHSIPLSAFSVQVSYVEIYRERVYDLLAQAPNKMQHKGSLKIREHPEDGVFVEHATQVSVSKYEDIKMLIDDGNRVRSVAATNINQRSSRSHAILTIFFRQTPSQAPDSLHQDKVMCKKSKICLVDLAGSERVDISGASGQRLREAGSINRSLATLADVISALSKPKGQGHGTFVPYRNSVLTRLLKESLGGNAKTVMLANISPCCIHYEETLSTLKYVERAKAIINTARVNTDSSLELVEALRREISELKAKLTLQHTAASTTAIVSPPMSPFSTSSIVDVVKAQKERNDMLPHDTPLDQSVFSAIVFDEKEKAKLEREIAKLKVLLKKKDKIMAANNNSMANMMASPEKLHRYRMLFRLNAISERFVLFKKYRAIERLKLVNQLWKMDQLYAHQIHSREEIEVQSDDLYLNDTLDLAVKVLNSPTSNSSMISTLECEMTPLYDVEHENDSIAQLEKLLAFQDDRVTNQQPERPVSSSRRIERLPSEYEEAKEQYSSNDMKDTYSEKKMRSIIDVTNQYHSASEEEDQDVDNDLDEAIKISNLEDLLKADMHDQVFPKYMKNHLISIRTHGPEEIAVFHSTQFQSPINDRSLSLECLASEQTFKRSATCSDPFNSPTPTEKKSFGLDECREEVTCQIEPQEEFDGNKLPVLDPPTARGNQDDTSSLLDIMTDSAQIDKFVKTAFINKINDNSDVTGSAVEPNVSTEIELISCQFDTQPKTGEVAEVMQTGIQVEDLFRLAHIGVHVLTEETGTQAERAVVYEADTQVVDSFQLGHKDIQVEPEPVHTEEIGTQAEEVKPLCFEASAQVIDLFHLAHKDIQVEEERAQTEDTGTQAEELKPVCLEAETQVVGLYELAHKDIQVEEERAQTEDTGTQAEELKPVCLEAETQVVGLYELAHKDIQVEEERAQTENTGTQAEELKPVCVEVDSQVIDLFEFVHTDTQVYVETEEMGTQAEEFMPLCLEAGSQVVDLVELSNKDIQVEEVPVNTEEIGVQVTEQSPMTAEMEVQVHTLPELTEMGCQAVEIKSFEEFTLQVEEPKVIQSDAELQVEIRNSQADFGIQTEVALPPMYEVCVQTEEEKKPTVDAENQAEKEMCCPSMDSSAQVELLVAPTAHAQIQVEEIKPSKCDALTETENKEYTHVEIQASFEQSVKEIQTQELSVDLVAAETECTIEFRTQDIQSDLTMEQIEDLEKLALCNTVVETEEPQIESTELITRSGSVDNMSDDKGEAVDFKEHLKKILEGFVKKQEIAVNVFTSVAAIEHTKWSMALDITDEPTNHETNTEESSSLLHINKRLYKTFSHIVTIFSAIEKKIEVLESLVTKSPIKHSDIEAYDLGFFQELIVGYSTIIHSFFECAKSNSLTEAYISEAIKQFSILQEVTTKEVSQLMCPSKTIPQDWKNIISFVLLDLVKASEKLKCELEYELEELDCDKQSGCASQSHLSEEQALPRRVVERKVPLSPSKRRRSHLDKINLWFEQAICTSPSKRKLLNLPEEENIDESAVPVTEDELMTMLELEKGACTGCMPIEKTIKVELADACTQVVQDDSSSQISEQEQKMMLEISELKQTIEHLKHTIDLKEELIWFLDGKMTQYEQQKK